MENHIGRVWIRGEVSGFNRHRTSGHCYFSLKDAQASLSCAWFRRQIRPGQNLQDGDQVLILGQVSIYEARGNYQLIVHQVEVGGQGDLHQQFVQLKNRLQELGLFDTQFKKKLPEHIQRIAIVTSKSGAAIQDALKTIARRNPLLDVAIFHAAVQGENAPESLMNALEEADKGSFDAILLTRGGGSLEDLMAFNHEGLAHTLFTLKTPVVSAVGHERDFTIADYVADVRAATPTAGAELLSPELELTRLRLQQHPQRLLHALQRQLNNRAQMLDQLTTRLFRVQPQSRTAYERQKILHKRHQLEQQIHQRIKHHRRTLNNAENLLLQAHPRYQLSRQKQYLQRQRQRLFGHVEKNLQKAQKQLDLLQQRLLRQKPRMESLRHACHHSQQRLLQSWHNAQQQRRSTLRRIESILDSLSPQRVLERGYSITWHAETGAIITSTEQLQPGDKIRTTLKQGEALSQVLLTMPAKGAKNSPGHAEKTSSDS